MTLYLLDTTCLIGLARDSQPTGTALQQLIAAGHALTTSTVNAAEFYTGAPRGRHQYVDALLESLPCAPVLFDDGVSAGDLRRTERQRGRTLTLPDALIAAVALRLDATIITENAKDFRLDGVRAVSLAEL